MAMSSSSRMWIAVLAVGCLALAGGFFFMSRSSRGADPGGAGGTKAAGGDAPVAAGTSNAAPGSAPGSAPGTGAAAGAPGATPAIARPTSGVGAMPYVPAKPLRYSDEPPAASASGDTASPVLQRVLAAAQVDAAQKETITRLWREHEDARRELQAALPPQNSARPPVPDRLKLNAIDLKFEQSVLTKVLRPEQAERVVAQSTGR